MSAPVRKFSFSSGEISPSLFARTDLNRYENGLRTCRNMIPMRQGGVTGRPGTEYVGMTLNAGQQVRLIPFIFNETGIGQSFLLEFGNQYITFYQNGANVVSATNPIELITSAYPAVVTSINHPFSNGDIIFITGVLGMTQVNNAYFIVSSIGTNTLTLLDLSGAPINSQVFSPYISGGIVNKVYKINSPYLQADLQNLHFDQSADIVTIAHPNYPPMELARSGQTNWSLNSITFAPPVKGPSLVSLSGTGGSTFYGYAVTSVNQNGEESDTLQLGYHAQAITPASVTTPITITWSQVSGAVYYRIYFDNHPILIGFGLRPTQLGYIGQTTALSFIDTGFTPDYTNTPPLSTTSVTPGVPFDTFSPLFSTPNNYPSTVGFIQQRRAFANTYNNPVGFWLSQPGDFYNYDTHVIPVDSDGVIASIAGQEVNAIQHILELKFALMLTAGAEIYVQGNGSGVVTPSAINASTQSQYGASSLKPLKVGDVLLFNQALGSFIRDFSFDFAIDGYRGNDITIFAAHLFEGYQLLDWAYQKVPDSIVWPVRSDGQLLSCTYIREQEVLAWAHHDFINGFVENIACIPENGEYAVYLSIRRFINGNTVRYIERMSSRIWTDQANIAPVQNDPINASYLDCFLQYDGRNSQTLALAQFQIISGVNDAIDIQVFGTDTGTVTRTVFIPAGSYIASTLALEVIYALGTMSLTKAGQPLAWGCSYSNSKFDIYQDLNGMGGESGYILKWKSGSYINSNAALILGYSLIDLPSISILHAWDAPAQNLPPSNLTYRNTMTLTVSGLFSTTTTAYTQSLTLTCSTNFFTSGMIGDQIFLEDQQWISSKGASGNQTRLIIQAYISATQVTVTSDTGIVPTEFQYVPVINWAHAVATVSGINHLEGQQVSVWADRFVVGSPLNVQVTEGANYTVFKGSITLDKPYSVIYVGLPMIQDIATLDLESYFGETMLAKRRRIGRCSVYLYNTRSFFAGCENPDTNEQNVNNDPLFQLYEEKDGRSQATYDQPPELLTSQNYVITPSRWQKTGALFLRNVDPVPFTLLALSPGEEDALQLPYKRF